MHLGHSKSINSFSSHLEVMRYAGGLLCTPELWTRGGVYIHMYMYIYSPSADPGMNLGRVGGSHDAGQRGGSACVYKCFGGIQTKGVMCYIYCSLVELDGFLCITVILGSTCTCLGISGLPSYMYLLYK